MERYFAERGAYPRNLESLVPGYLDAVPVDPMSGGALKYLRFVDGGRCRIWSVGWDEEDDGGVRALNEEDAAKTRYHRREYEGDWVWSYAP